MSKPHSQSDKIKPAQPEYISFLLRMWKDGEAGPWRASLENPGTRESHKFSDLRALIAFLEARTGETVVRIVADHRDESVATASPQG